MSDYQPGVYTKGSTVRIADNASEAVALIFDGFRRQGEAPQEDGSASYRSLQEQAKARGIPANQSAELLAEAIADHDA